MAKQTRQRLSPEYKEQSVARLSQPGATHSSVAAELGVTPTQLNTWRLELEAAGSAAADIPFDSEQAERFRRRIEQLVPYNYGNVVGSRYPFAAERAP